VRGRTAFSDFLVAVGFLVALISVAADRADAVGLGGIVAIAGGLTRFNPAGPGETGKPPRDPSGTDDPEAASG
jgi:hypothetical protein